MKEKLLKRLTQGAYIYTCTCLTDNNDSVATILDRYQLSSKRANPCAPYLIVKNKNEVMIMLIVI